MHLHPFSLVTVWAVPLKFRPYGAKEMCYYFLTLGIYSRGGLKIDENDWKGMMLSPCSQGPAGCRVAEQHWNAAPAPKLADTND